MPIPKIEVTEVEVCDITISGAQDDVFAPGTKPAVSKAPDGSNSNPHDTSDRRGDKKEYVHTISAPDGDGTHQARTSSVKDGIKKRKRSIMHGLEKPLKLRSFKNFVESKILSKSNLALELDEETTTEAAFAVKGRSRTLSNRENRRRMHGSVSIRYLSQVHL